MRESEVVGVAEGKARMTTEAGRSGPGFQWDRQRGKKRVNREQATLSRYVLFCLLLHVKIAKALADRMPSLFDASALFTATHWLPTARNPDDAFIFWGGDGGASCVCVLTSYPCTGERIRRKMLEYELQKDQMLELSSEKQFIQLRSTRHSFRAALSRSFNYHLNYSVNSVETKESCQHF